MAKSSSKKAGKVAGAALYVTVAAGLGTALSSDYVADMIAERSEAFAEAYGDGTTLAGVWLRLLPGAVGVLIAGLAMKGKKRSVAQALIGGGALLGAVTPYARAKLDEASNYQSEQTMFTGGPSYQELGVGGTVENLGGEYEENAIQNF